MKTFILVNLYAILVGITGYVAGVLTGGVVRVIVEDIWVLVKGSVLLLIDVLGRIFRRR